MQNDEILKTFEETYLQQGSFELLDYSVNNKGGNVYFNGQVQMHGDIIDIDVTGNGPLSSFIDGLAQHTGKSLHIINYAEHAINPHHNSGDGIDDDTNNDNKTNANAAAYIQLNVDGKVYSGIGTCSSTVSAMLKGALSAFAQAVGKTAA